jgi:hypothetical protein
MTLAASLSLPGGPAINSLGAFDDGTTRWLALRVGANPGPVLFAVANAEGAPVTVLRAPDQSKCDFGHVAVGSGHFSVVVISSLSANTADQGVLVGALDPGVTPAISALTPSDKNNYPWVEALLFGRAYWKYGAGLSISSCDWDTGKNVRDDLLAPAAGGEIEDIIATPDGIMFDVRLNPNMALVKLDSNTPGKSKTFFADSKADVFMPAYTGTHLAWLRGEGHMPDESYSKLELWASPYSGDPATLAPTLVTAWPWNGAWQMGGRGAGWRRRRGSSAVTRSLYIRGTCRPASTGSPR